MQLIIIPALIYGLFVGIYEVFTIHRDVLVLEGRLGHTVHAILLSMFFVLCTMNAELIIDLITPLKSMSLAPFVFKIIIGLIAATKIHIITRMRTTGFRTSETWLHSILIGGFVFAAPNVYALIQPLFSRWLV